MGATLLIMAAGMGSRYGGNKQVDGLGPNGEILMEYSIYDAIRAGFDKVVFVIKPGMKETLASICGDRIAKKVKVDYAFQDFTSVPAFYHVPEERTKPFARCTRCSLRATTSTSRSPSSTRTTITACPRSARFTKNCRRWRRRARRRWWAISCKTPFPKTARCRAASATLSAGNLDKVVETLKIKLCENGEIRDIGAGEPGELLDPLAPVSMNFWGFTPWIFGKLEEYFANFLKGLAPDAIKAECLLPVFVDELMHKGELTVPMLTTDAVWFGVTYKEDKPFVQAELRKLHESGVYPASLHE